MNPAGPPFRNDNERYLREEQYRTDANLLARIRLHERFSTNPQCWHRWTFGHMKLIPNARILELGAGTGASWASNAERIDRTWRLVLTDFSPRMLESARQACRSLPNATFAVADAQAIPFVASSFDAVVANNVLYHVPDRRLAVKEIHRVLAPHGMLYAGAHGRAHLKELHELLAEFSFGHQPPRHADSFGLETGPAQLTERFVDVTVFRYDDALEITDAEALIDYVLSFRSPGSIDLASLRTNIERRIAKRGYFRITKDFGLLTARPR
jgi:SAM-dependent methyltransferase